ncbi:MAG: response regulator [Anaerolineae bacterium]|nr:response regulator [Anaerolineae bacterium]
MKHILIIEDDETLRSEVAFILELEGYSVQTAPNGWEGLAIIHATPPDLIICDILMPQMDGYMVLLEVRSHAETEHIPLIFLTAKARRPDLRKGMELGADDYLTKPFTPAELIAAVEARLQRKRLLTQTYDTPFRSLRHRLIHALPRGLQLPLDAIEQYTWMLLDEDMLSHQQVYQIAEGIDRTATRMHRLIEEYLFFVQMELMELQPERLRELQAQVTEDLPELVRATFIHEATLQERKDDLHFALERAPVRIGDEYLAKLVRQVAQQTLKASSLGQVIEVRGWLADEHYCLSMTDPGQGIAESALQAAGAEADFWGRLQDEQGVGLWGSSSTVYSSCTTHRCAFNSCPAKLRRLSLSYAVRSMSFEAQSMGRAARRFVRAVVAGVRCGKATGCGSGAHCQPPALRNIRPGCLTDANRHPTNPDPPPPPLATLTPLPTLPATQPERAGVSANPIRATFTLSPATQTATFLPTLVGLTVEYFITNTERVSAGDNLTLFWRINGASAARIYRLDSAGERARFWDVGPEGRLTVASDPEAVSGAVFVIEASLGGALVQQELAVPTDCPFVWYFAPEPEGCPADAAQPSLQVEQRFERGRMLWLAESQQIYALFDDGDQPAWVVVEDAFREGDPERDESLVPPEGLLQPIRGFGAAWRNEANLQARLGWAVDAEVGYDGLVQGSAGAPEEQVLFLRARTGEILRLDPAGQAWSAVEAAPPEVLATEPP